MRNSSSHLEDKDWCWEPFKILLPSEYRVPSGYTRSTSEDKKTGVNLKQISTWWLTNVHKTKLSFKNSCRDTVAPDILNLLLFMITPSRPVYWCQPHTVTSLLALPTSGTPPSWFSTSPECSCQLSRTLFVSSDSNYVFHLQMLKFQKPGELISFVLSITLIITFVNV